MIQRIDLAPLDGITKVVFRQVWARHFGGADRYFMPFFSPTDHHTITPRDFREIDPVVNANLPSVPQIMSCKAPDFLWAVERLKEMGYTEVNLNLGCPSGTVTAKGKGAGMLADPDALDRFLGQVFDGIPCRLSVKTRLGMSAPEEFDRIIPVYNRYPMSELIIHPRVRADLYRHPVREQVFRDALPRLNMPVTWNGSIVTFGDFEACQANYPQLKGIMIGQGLVSDPALAGKCKGGASCDKDALRAFHDRLLDAYAVQFESRNNAFKRMKDIWFYLIRLFADSEKYGKHILKSKTYEEYSAAVSAVFRELMLLTESSGGW